MRYLSLFAAVLAAGCATAPSNQSSTQFEWQFKGSTDYEAKSPGAGTGKRYESHVGWIDVYFFGAGRDNWLQGTADPGFMAVFGEAAQGIIQAQKDGHYKNVAIGEPREVRVAGHTFKHFTARFELRGQLVESHTFMTALNGHLLKYRMSFPHPPPNEITDITKQFIERTVESYEKPSAGGA